MSGSSKNAQKQPNRQKVVTNAWKGFMCRAYKIYCLKRGFNFMEGFTIEGKQCVLTLQKPPEPNLHCPDTPPARQHNTATEGHLLWQRGALASLCFQCGALFAADSSVCSQRLGVCLCTRNFQSNSIGFRRDMSSGELLSDSGAICVVGVPLRTATASACSSRPRCLVLFCCFGH